MTREKNDKQARAELCQAQFILGLAKQALPTFTKPIFTKQASFPFPSKASFPLLRQLSLPKPALPSKASRMPTQLMFQIE